MGSFYLTLPSFGDGNRISSYRTKLDEIIEVPGTWEIGLAEIMFPATWMNVTSRNNWLRFCYTKKGGNDNIALQTRNHCETGYSDLTKEIHPGHYTREALAKEIDCQLNIFTNGEKYEDQRCNRKHFIYDAETGRLEYTGSETVAFSIHRDLAEILGFKQRRFAEKRSFSMIPLEPEPMNFYIYCNLITPQFVGAEKGQLIGIVPCGERNKTRGVYHAMNPIQYYPLRYHQIDSIEIDIRDSKGEIVPFYSGHSLVRLHVRKALKT